MDRPLPGQIRAARAFLDWSKMDLARLSRTSVSLVQRYESGDGQGVPEDVVALMQDALETEGVRFLQDDGGGAGVRLKRS